MSEHIQKKNLPPVSRERIPVAPSIYFLLLTSILGVTLFIVTESFSKADTFSTSVTVGNAAPGFNVFPKEAVASTSTNPTNVGSSVSFNATASDNNNDNYYLIVCSSNSVTPHANSAPTCNATTFCTSNSTSSTAQATCSYTTQIGNAESNPWYAFACDYNSSSECSSASQGTLSDGTESPFKVNHAPVFTSVNDNGPFDPGQTVTFTSVSSETDVDGTGDSMKLFICDSNSGATYAGGCSGGTQICASNAVTTNASCELLLPNVTAAATITYYAYVIDSHEFAASSISDTYTIRNTAPVVTDVYLNSGDDLILSTGNSTTDFSVVGTVSDSNSCQDLSTVTTSVYRSGIGYATNCDGSGDANANNCYPVVNCTVSGGSCSGASDANANYTCTVSIQYHADPTDSNTQFNAENWLSTLVATDSAAATDNEISTGVEMQSFLHMTLGSDAIGYGPVSAGSDTGASNQALIIRATGNVGLDTDLSGDDMTSGSDTIAVTNQKYGINNSDYSAGDRVALTSSFVELELNVLKTVLTLSPKEKNIYWGIAIPQGTPSGSYTGADYITAIKSEFAEW